jgi:putative flippase GtrA
MSNQLLTANLKQFITFSIIGVINTLIHYGVFIILLNTTKLHYLLSSTIGYFIGIINSYILNKNITFKSKSKNHLAEFFKFVAVNIMALAVNLLILKSLVDILELAPEFAQVFGILGSLTANFLGNKIWTFKT